MQMMYVCGQFKIDAVSGYEDDLAAADGSRGCTWDVHGRCVNSQLRWLRCGCYTILVQVPTYLTTAAAVIDVVGTTYSAYSHREQRCARGR